MKEWLLKIGAGILAAGLFVLGVFGLKNFILNRKADKLVDDNKKDNKELQIKLDVLDDKQHSTDVKEGKVDQQIEDLKDQKVDQAEIADFIDMLEKKAKK